MAWVTLARPIAQAYKRLFAKRSTQLMDLGDYSPRSGLSYLDEYDYPKDVIPIAKTFDFHRERIPIYRPDFDGIDYQRINVPDQTLFRFGKKDLFPVYTPHITVRNHGSYLRKIPKASAIIDIRRQNDRRKIREENRKRDKYESKVPRAVRRLHAFANRTYGTYSEAAEISSAFHSNQGDPMGFITALGINEAVDRAYGARARFLREQIYSRDFYRLPFGIDFIIRPFRR